jgi:hypothetical protein
VFKNNYRPERAKQGSEERIEKKIVSLFTTIVLALAGRLFARGDSITQGVALGCHASALQAGIQTASVLQVPTVQIVVGKLILLRKQTKT